MLNPDQVRRLRSSADAGQIPSTFDGYQIRTEPVTISPCVRRPDLIVEEPGVSGPFYGPQHIFGVPTDTSCLDGIGAWTIDYPTRHLFRTANARIIGNTAVLDGSGVLCSPDPVTSQAELTAALQQNDTNYQGFVLRKVGDGAVATFVAGRQPRRLRRNALFFHNLESANYGSFLIRQMPQFLVAESLFGAYDCYVVPDRTPWFSEACALFGLPDRPTFTVREVCGEIFDTVLIWDAADAEGFMPLDLRSKLCRAVLRNTPLTGPKKIFVSRSLSSISRPGYRNLLNEHFVEEVMSNAGYAIVHPESLKFQVQAELFAGADRIVGLSGSGMINSLFARPGAKLLDIESFTNNVRQHAKLYASGGLDYSFAFGTIIAGETEPLPFRNWTLAAETLDQAVAWLRQ